MKIYYVVRHGDGNPNPKFQPCMFHIRLDTAIQSRDGYRTPQIQQESTQIFQISFLQTQMALSQMLLSHVLGVESIMLYTDPDRPASNEERARLRDLVTRAARQEPVQHLVGEGFFLGRSFEVTASVLIPPMMLATPLLLRPSESALRSSLIILTTLSSTADFPDRGRPVIPIFGWIPILCFLVLQR